MYCGIDIIEVDRIKKACKNIEFIDKIYTKKEYQSLKDIKSDMKYQKLAGKFAGKEAIYKAVSKICIENNVNIFFNEIEILNIDELKGRPEVNILNKDCENLLNEYIIDISISHIKDTATAICILNKK